MIIELLKFVVAFLAVVTFAEKPVSKYDRKCVYNGVSYSEGDSFLSEDFCNTCTCSEGSVSCTEMFCIPLGCVASLSYPGYCCPDKEICKCIYDGREYSEGESIPNKDCCGESTCRGGRIDCVLPPCLKPPENCLFKNTSSCCNNECERCFIGEKLYDLGETFPAANICEECVCTIDGIQCHTPACVHSDECSQFQEQCCGFTCARTCERDGIIYFEGDEIPRRPEDHICTFYFCTNGEIKTTMKDCAMPENCVPKEPRERCCPTDYVCDGRCVSSDLEEYQEGATVPSNDPCSKCICSGGEITCSPFCDPPSVCTRYEQPLDCCDFKCENSTTTCKEYDPTCQKGNPKVKEAVLIHVEDDFVSDSYGKGK